jgi:hypothetical protein
VERRSGRKPGARVLIPVRLFTPGEGNALAKSKVHQISRARDYGSWVDLLTDLKNMAVCQEWDKQDFNFQKHISGLENTCMQKPSPC